VAELIERPVDGVVRVWLVDLDAPFDAGVLDDEEQARAARITRPTTARRWTASRAALRAIIGACAGLEPAQVTLAPSGPQKPVDGLHTSLSHSAQLAAIALALEPVGIDIEVARIVAQPERLAVRLGADAVGRLRAAAPGEESAALLREWTRREAALKLSAEDPWLRDLELAGATGAVAAGRPLAPVVRDWP
jgi:4'-phosphopantetheinyl transferase